MLLVKCGAGAGVGLHVGTTAHVSNSMWQLIGLGGMEIIPIFLFPYSTPV